MVAGTVFVYQWLTPNTADAIGNYSMARNLLVLGNIIGNYTSNVCDVARCLLYTGTYLSYKLVVFLAVHLIASQKNSKKS